MHNNREVCVQKVLDGYDVFCRYAPVLQYCGPSVCTASSCRDPVLIFLLVACLARCRPVGGAAAISQYMFSSDGVFAEFVTGAGESLLLEVLRLRRITQHWTQQAVVKQHRRMQRKTNTIRSMRSCRSSSRVFRVSWSSRSWHMHSVSLHSGVGCSSTDASVVVGCGRGWEVGNLAALPGRGRLRLGLMLAMTMVVDCPTGTLVEMSRGLCEIFNLIDDSCRSVKYYTSICIICQTHCSLTNMHTLVSLFITLSNV